jgi:hypothetical protein
MQDTWLGLRAKAPDIRENYPDPGIARVITSFRTPIPSPNMGKFANYDKAVIADG